MARRKKEEGESAPKATGAPKVARKLEGLDKKTLALIENTATKVRGKIDQRSLPELKFPRGRCRT
jgi:hypothetical protein